MEMHCQFHGIYEIGHFFARSWTQCKKCLSEDESRRNKADEPRKKEEAKANLIRRLTNAGIVGHFQNCDFDSYLASSKEQHYALAVSRKYANNFEMALDLGKNLILSGKKGTGKTHLASAVGINVLKNTQKSVVFVDTYEALKRIKNTWSKSSNQTAEQVCSEFIKADLLILDEFGSHTKSDSDTALLFDLMNLRYRHKKPCVVVSNLTPQEIESFDSRLFDRLKTGGTNVIPFNWESYRK